MTYRIEIKPSAKKELAQLPREIGESVVKAIAALAENSRPHGYKKTDGFTTELSYSSWKLSRGVFTF